MECMSPFSGPQCRIGSDGLLTISDIKGFVELVTPEPRLGSFGSDVSGSDFVFERKKP